MLGGTTCPEHVPPPKSTRWIGSPRGARSYLARCDLRLPDRYGLKGVDRPWDWTPAKGTPEVTPNDKESSSDMFTIHCSLDNRRSSRLRMATVRYIRLK